MNNNKKRILVLPVDGRPVTREQVILLGEIAAVEVIFPAVEDLGYFRNPADRKTLLKWVREHAAQVDGFIFSIDMLVYGGLVPSRFIEDSLPQLTPWLDVLKELKGDYPHKPIYAFCATMRMSNNNENEEEKLYWAEHGKHIWQWSFYSDRFECLAQECDNEKAQQAKSAIPSDIREDYLQTRERNFALTEQVLTLVEQGIIERLILPQDDTAEFGFNIKERRQLQQYVSTHDLTDKVLIYPGADEVVYTLFAHILEQANAHEPVKFALHIHHSDKFNNLIARYEDRPAIDSITSQIHAAGAQLVDDIEKSDIVIAVHWRGYPQGDWAMQVGLDEDLGIDQNWLDKLAEIQKPIALLDLAYANGADPELIPQLPTKLTQLLAFGAWNTASNSIGSLVAQSVLAFHAGNNSAQQCLLATRFADDYLYQSDVRQSLRQCDLAEGSDEQLAKLAELFVAKANQWLSNQGFDSIKVESVYQPWQRTFEIGINMAQTSREAAK